MMAPSTTGHSETSELNDLSIRAIGKSQGRAVALAVIAAGVIVRRPVSEDGRAFVTIVVDNQKSVGGIDQVAWVGKPPGIVREIAADLVEAASTVENANQTR